MTRPDMVLEQSFGEGECCDHRDFRPVLNADDAVEAGERPKAAFANNPEAHLDVVGVFLAYDLTPVLSARLSRMMA